MTAEKLDTAIQLIEAGNRQAAVLALREIIKENAGDEDAWFLLSTCMDQVEHKKFCLQSVLTINPENQQARDALSALTAPVAFEWTQPENARPLSAQQFSTEHEKADEIVWDTIESDATEQEKMTWERTEPEKAEPEKMVWDQAEPDEVVWEKAEPKQAEREKMEWERTDSEHQEQERLEQEKVAQKRAEREKAELQRVETLKMEWERTEAERQEHQREKEKQEKIEPESVAPLKIEWDDWDEAQPVRVQPLNQKSTKVLTQSVSRRKTHSKQRSLLPLVAGMIALFVMLFTVLVVFLAQILTSAP